MALTKTAYEQTKAIDARDRDAASYVGFRDGFAKAAEELGMSKEDFVQFAKIADEIIAKSE